jgi:Myb DNA-binding like
MSSPVTIAIPSKSKRRPSFRPSNNRKAAKKAATTDDALQHPSSKNIEESELSNAPQDNLQQEPVTAGTESSNFPSGDDGESLTAKQSQKSKARPRKRKTTVLAVGASRRKSPMSSALVVVVAGNRSENEISNEASTTTLTTRASTEQGSLMEPHESPDATSKSQQTSHMPLELIPPIIPENTAGKPLLSSFCSAFPKPKKRRGPTAAPAAAQPAQEGPEQPPATQEPAAGTQQKKQHAGPVVQIVNGEIVLQESSIVFQGSGADHDGAGDHTMTVVEEEVEMGVAGATYTSFATGRRARPKTQHWTVEETQLFYEALRQVGLDFGTMEAYFESSDNPNIRKRLRRQLKRKYQAESTKNPKLVDKALKPAGRVDIDLSVFQLTEESVKEMQAEKEKEQQLAKARGAPAAGAANGVGGELEVARDEALVEDVAATQKPTDRQQATRTDEDFLWPDAGNGVEAGKDDNNEATEEVFDDPIFFEDQDNVAATAAKKGEEEAPTLALVHGVRSKASKKKKPKFRSARKKTAKAK